MSKYRKFLIIWSGLVLTLILLSSCGALKETADEWETYRFWEQESKKTFSLRGQVSSLNLKGADEEFGSSIVLRQTTSAQGTSKDYSYHASALEPESQNAIFLGTSLKVFNNYALNINTWGMETDGSGFGRSDAGSPGGTTTYANYVRMWNNDFFTANERTPSGFSPIDYYGELNVNHRVFDTNFIMPLYRTPKYNKPETILSWSVGLRAGSSKHEIKQGLTLNAFDYNWVPGEDSDNMISYDAQSKSQIKSFLGPALALYMEFKPIWWFNIESRISQSYLFGNAQLKGDLININDTRYYVNGTNNLTGTQYDYAIYPFKKEISVTMPVTELEINLVLPIKPWLKFRISSFVSIWNNYPFASTLEYVDDGTRQYPVWHTRKENISFTAPITIYAFELKF
jgi:hypothetical protein